MTAREVKDRRAELVRRREELREVLAQGGGRGERLELAGVEEDILQCDRLLRELMPRHHISTRAVRSPGGIDRGLYRLWLADTLGKGDNSADVELMRQSVQAAIAALSERQRGDLLASLQGERPVEIARRRGVGPSTVRGNLRRAQGILERYGKAIYTFRRHGSMDFGDRACLEAIGTILTPGQMTCLALYYGEWMSCGEIGALLGLDRAVVYRKLRRALYKLSYCMVGEDSRPEMDLGRLEDLILEGYNGLRPPEERQRRQWPPRTGTAAKRFRWTQPMTELQGALLAASGRPGDRGFQLGPGPTGGRLRAWLEERQLEAEERYPGRGGKVLFATLREIFCRFVSLFRRERGSC